MGTVRNDAEGVAKISRELGVVGQETRHTSTVLAQGYAALLDSGALGSGEAGEALRTAIGDPHKHLFGTLNRLFEPLANLAAASGAKTAGLITNADESTTGTAARMRRS